jgi:uncharacterized protein (DUF305 family)
MIHQTPGVPVETLPGRPSRVQVAALAVAAAFLCASVGYVIGQRPDRPSAAEVGFLLDMVAHHEQAVELSRAALADDLPAGVESFAVEVVADQQYEIGIMEAVLQRWGHARQDEDGLTMGWMGDPVPDDRMPGLASAADIARLGRARGDEAAALWLALMTTHHQGGIHMASAAVSRVDDPYVHALATRMARNQRIEIEEYAAVATRLGLAAPTGLTSVPVPVGESHDSH